MKRFTFTFFAFAMFAQAQAFAQICVCSCDVNPNPLTFGQFVPVNNAALDVATSIDVVCTGLAVISSYTITMDGGLYGTIAARQMRSGSDPLNYNIYKDFNRTQIWGGTGSGLVVSNFLGVLSWSQNTPVYGRIPAATATKPGNYSDTIVVTVTW